MPFDPNDLYLASGSSVVTNSWTPAVEKHTPSSFYNYEEDNLPIYDLEERTDHLWERMGYPIQDGFSGIPGMVFLVSGSAPAGGGNVFPTCQAAVDVLPDYCDFPVIIELGVQGDLGDLNLSNKHFASGLEIINRKFARGHSTSATAYPVAGFLVTSSTDIQNTFADTVYLYDGSPMYTAADWTGADGFHTYHSVLPVDEVINSKSEELYGGSYDSVINFTGFAPTSIEFVVATTYNNGTLEDRTVSVASDRTVEEDIRAIHDVTDSIGVTGMKRPSPISNQRVRPLYYGSFFRNVTVDNVGGAVYLRNILCEGPTSNLHASLSYDRAIGFGIYNSTVVLENCTASRYNKSGFDIINSDVTFSRGIMAYRCFSIVGGGDVTRVPNDAAGIRMTNSNGILSGTHQYASGVDFVFMAGRCENGLVMKSSNLTGGTSRDSNGDPESQTAVTMYRNQNTNITMLSSEIDASIRLDVALARTNLLMSDSMIKVNDLICDYAQFDGIKASNSKIVYNRDLVAAPAVEFMDQFSFQRNGTHMTLNNSLFIPQNYDSSGNTIGATSTSGTGSYYDYYGKMNFSNSHGATKSQTGSKTSKPGIILDSASYAEFVHTTIQVEETDTASINYAGANDPIYGQALNAINGSTAKFKSSRKAATIVKGRADFDTQQQCALIYGGTGASIEFNGPTFLGNAGIDVLVEDGSICTFQPHRHPGGGYDVSAWDLDDSRNHTFVELHSTRAALVANRNSRLVMRDLGDVHAFWPDSETSSIDLNYATVADSSGATSGAYMMFYPNPPDSVATVSTHLDVGALNGNGIDVNFLLVNYAAPTSETDYEAYSHGGTCVRAMQGSEVEVQNVHFPAGHWNTSGQFYDASAGQCEKLMIWNIADDSRLNASLCSVSGVHPSLAGYNGPSAVYVSGADIPASGAPDSTPGTSSLSVLDSFGVSGATAGTNKGPFRLYVSVDPKAKWFGYVSGADIAYNTPVQQLAQGYNVSGNVAAADSVSSLFIDVSSTTFFHTSAVLDPGGANRIWLDESAANTFANAKNGAQTMSGRIPICRIYRARTDETGEGYSSTTPGRGVGFLGSNVFDLRRKN